MNKQIDRMPKEYKVAVYALVIGTTYFFLYSLIFFGKFRYKPFFTVSLVIVLTYAALTIFLIMKFNWARILLAVMSILQSILFFLTVLSLLFFKQSTAFLSKVLHTGSFTFYLILGQLNVTPDRGLFAALIIAGWSIFVAYLLLHKDTKSYIKNKTYVLADTHKETSIAVIVLFLLIIIIYFLAKF